MRRAGAGPGCVGGEAELGFGEPGEVAQVAVKGGLVAVRDGEQPSAVLAGETRPEQGFRLQRELDPILTAEDPAGLGEVADEQGVPAEEVLVVARRLRPLVAQREELGAGAGEAFPRGVVALELRDVLTLEVALVRKAVGLGERESLVAQNGGHFRGRPHVGRAFVVIRVGVQRGREQPVGRAHLAEEPADRLFADVDVERVAVTGPGLGVGAEQLGVVVEHLLEVRHRPVAVHAVAMEAAADLVEEPAAGHGAERDGQDGVDARREGAVRFDRGGAAQTEQEVKRVRGGELRCGAEAAEGVVMLFADAAGGRDEVVRHRRAPVGVGRPGEVRQVLRDGVGVRGEFGLVAMVEVRDAHQ